MPSLFLSSQTRFPICSGHYPEQAAYASTRGFPVGTDPRERNNLVHSSVEIRLRIKQDNRSVSVLKVVDSLSILPQCAIGGYEQADVIQAHSASDPCLSGPVGTRVPCPCVASQPSKGHYERLYAPYTRLNRA